MRVLIFVFAVALLAAAPASHGAPLGSSAPTFSLTSLDGAARATVVPGKITVLNFWATWCPPCRAETPDLIAAYARLHASDVGFLGIDTTETAPIVRTFLSAKGVTYPVALAGPQTYNAYGISYIPTTVVVDAAGIVRARWVGGVTPTQLAQYVADAKAGRSSLYVSPVQARIDALLALPAKGEMTPAQAEHAIARAEALAKDHATSVDYERTQHAEGRLLVAVGAAARARATTDAQRVAAFVVSARGAGDLNRWDDAIAAYRSAAALAPHDAKLVAALSRAYYRLHDYPRMIAYARRYTELRPDDGDGWADLGLAYARARRYASAAPAYERALRVLSAVATSAPRQDALADVADTSLDAANVYVSLGDAAGAHRSFARANAFADRLRPGGPYAELKRNVKERTQEGNIAVALASGAGKPVVSVTPWTGPDLPGSLVSTLKYRLIVAAPADADVTLRAQGLRPDWVASFCADGLCSPQTVSFKSPPSGVKTYEFQLVPPHEGDAPGSVAISVGGGSTVSVPAAPSKRAGR